MARKHLHIRINHAELAELDRLKVKIAETEAVIRYMRYRRAMLKLDIEIHKGQKAESIRKYNALLKKQKTANGLHLKEGPRRPPGPPNLRGLSPIR